MKNKINVSGRGVDFAKQTGLYQEKKKRRLVMKGAVIALAIAFFAFAGWGGTYFYKLKQENVLAEIKNKIKEEQDSRDYKNLAEILNLASKLNFVGEFSQKQKLWSELFSEIQKKMLPSVYLTDLEGSSQYLMENNDLQNSQTQFIGGVTTDINDNKINLGLVTNSLGEVAKQVIAFKDSDKIKTITIGGISLEDTGLEFSMIIELEPDALEKTIEIREEQSPNEEL